MKRQDYYIYIDGKKVATKYAWNSARREGMTQLAKVMKGSQIEQIEFEITEKHGSLHISGNFTFESDTGHIKTFYIERADDNI